MATKIAIVEDDEAISQMYRIKFEGEGYTVETASNGKLGLALAEEMRPDIMLLDLMMPIMDGEAMLIKMRKTDWGRKIKVIILTNRGEQEIPDSIKQAGIEALILKAAMTPRQVAELVKQKLGLAKKG